MMTFRATFLIFSAHCPVIHRWFLSLKLLRFLVFCFTLFFRFYSSRNIESMKYKLNDIKAFQKIYIISMTNKSTSQVLHTRAVFFGVFFTVNFHCIFFQKMTVSSLRDWLWVLAGSTSKHFFNCCFLFAIEMWTSSQNFSSKFPGIKKILKNFKSHFWKNALGAYGLLRDWLWVPIGSTSKYFFN